MSKKIPIHVGKEDEVQINDLMDLLGYTSVYGGFPKTVKESIILTRIYIESLEKVIPDLPEAKLDLLFQSIKRLKKRKKLLAEAAKAQEMAEKV